jgi:hypothetical protein
MEEGNRGEESEMREREGVGVPSSVEGEVRILY